MHCSGEVSVFGELPRSSSKSNSNSGLDSELLSFGNTIFGGLSLGDFGYVQSRERILHLLQIGFVSSHYRQLRQRSVWLALSLRRLQVKQPESVNALRGGYLFEYECVSSRARIPAFCPYQSIQRILVFTRKPGIASANFDGIGSTKSLIYLGCSDLGYPAYYNYLLVILPMPPL